MKWHVPSQAEIDLAKEILDSYLHGALVYLRSPENLSEYGS